MTNHIYAAWFICTDSYDTGKYMSDADLFPCFFTPTANDVFGFLFTDSWIIVLRNCICICRRKLLFFDDFIKYGRKSWSHWKVWNEIDMRLQWGLHCGVVLGGLLKDQWETTADALVFLLGRNDKVISALIIFPNFFYTGMQNYSTVQEITVKVTKDSSSNVEN